jgi:hypothetical protein
VALDQRYGLGAVGLVVLDDDLERVAGPVID